MEIFPQDLGPEAETEIQQTRLLFPGDLPEPRHSGRRNILGGGSVVDLGLLTAGWVLHLLWLVIVSGIGGIVLISLSLILRRNGMEGPPEVPLAEHEVRNVQQVAKDMLTRSYFDLVIAAINTPPMNDADTDHSVRAAIRALGGTITDLPPHFGAEHPDDPEALQAEAARLTAEIATETDAVVAASLRRRAEALARQAEIAARTAMLLRRNDALRQEIAGQIAALRTSLTAFRVGGRQNAPELADLAANIQTVALEAGAVTQARDEIDSLISRL